MERACRAAARSRCRWRAASSFNTDRTWRRKVAETVVALELEHRFTKQQIFELYANEIYLGNRGSFAIHGFGEASLAYFNKDLREVSSARSRVSGGNHPRAEPLFDRGAPARARGRGARPRARWRWPKTEPLPPSRRRTPRKLPLQIVGGGARRQHRAVFCGHGEGPPARPIFRSGSALPEFPRLHHARSGTAAGGLARPSTSESRTLTASLRGAMRGGARKGSPRPRRRWPLLFWTRTPEKSRR